MLVDNDGLTTAVGVCCGVISTASLDTWKTPSKARYIMMQIPNLTSLHLFVTVSATFVVASFASDSH